MACPSILSFDYSTRENKGMDYSDMKWNGKREERKGVETVEGKNLNEMK